MSTINMNVNEASNYNRTQATQTNAVKNDSDVKNSDNTKKTAEYVPPQDIVEISEEGLQAYKNSTMAKVEMDDIAAAGGQPPANAPANAGGRPPANAAANGGGQTQANATATTSGQSQTNATATAQSGGNATESTDSSDSEDDDSLSDTELYNMSESQLREKLSNGNITQKQYDNEIARRGNGSDSSDGDSLSA